MPDRLIHSWIIDELQKMHIPNLGVFMRESARNVTIFRGISLHQDIIDFPLRHPDFITFYIYLDAVGEKSAPLIFAPDSHLNGIQKFPHKISGDQVNGPISYENKFLAEYKLQKYLGEAGDAAFWHPYLLHGTKPVTTSEPRISLRLLIEKNADVNKGCLLDLVNSNIGPLECLEETRSD